MTIAPPTVRCRVSVVICAYTEDRWSRLVVAVESVRAQTCPAEEVVLVIDHCPPLAARARSEFTDIVVTENDSAQGRSPRLRRGPRCSMRDFLRLSEIMPGAWNIFWGRSRSYSRSS